MTIRRLQLALAAFLVLAVGRRECAGQAASPPLQPIYDAAGNFAHPPGVSVSVVSISPSGLVVECRQGATVWRERYAVQGGKLVFVSVSTQHRVPAEAAHDEWQETMLSQGQPDAAGKEGSVPVAAVAPGAGNALGATSVDPRWSRYGDYLTKLVGTVQTEFDRLRIGTRIFPKSGSRVSIRFVLNSRGEVGRIVSVDFTPGLPDRAVRACLSALTAHSPYGPWTDDMVAVLGPEQEMTFAFYYP